LIDWGAGQYEQTAAELEPVAERVIEAADLAPGSRLLDIGCGTGNAALLAARQGARATGVDPASRLIDVGRERAAIDGLDVDFIVGDAQFLGFRNGDFDTVVSVFGLIFADDPELAFAEALRVLDGDGQALITAWIPAGPIDEVVGTIGRAVAAATGQTRARFAWHEDHKVRELAERHGATAEFEDTELVITAPSPEAYVERQAGHPMQIAARAALESAGTYDDVMREVATIFERRNEDPGSFRVTSPYRIIRLRHATA
jgi:SAM-dependent methyltransferase